MCTMWVASCIPSSRMTSTDDLFIRYCGSGVTNDALFVIFNRIASTEHRFYLFSLLHEHIKYKMLWKLWFFLFFSRLFGVLTCFHCIQWLFLYPRHSNIGCTVYRVVKWITLSCINEFCSPLFTICWTDKAHIDLLPS